MFPFFATNKTVAEYEALVKPFFDKLDSLSIPYQKSTQHFDTFYPAYKATFGTINYRVGGYTSVPGNRILPAVNWETPDLSKKTLDAVKQYVIRISNLLWTITNVCLSLQCCR